LRIDLKFMGFLFCASLLLVTHAQAGTLSPGLTRLMATKAETDVMRVLVDRKSVV